MLRTAVHAARVDHGDGEVLVSGPVRSAAATRGPSADGANRAGCAHVYEGLTGKTKFKIGADETGVAPAQMFVAILERHADARALSAESQQLIDDPLFA